MSGWIKLHRSIMEHWIFDEPEALKFWVTLLFDANHKNKKTVLAGRLVDVKRGQLVFGRTAYSEKTGITERKIRRYMEMLIQEEMVVQQTTNRYSLISIVNYENYQANNSENVQQASSQKQQITGNSEKERPADVQPESTELLASGDLSIENGPADVQQTSSRGPHLKNDKNVKNRGLNKFTPPTVEEIRDYCQSRGNSVDPETFFAHYDSVNWFRGKTKIKNWKSCVITWEKNQKSTQQDDYVGGGI